MERWQGEEERRRRRRKEEMMKEEGVQEQWRRRRKRRRVDEKVEVEGRGQDWANVEVKSRHIVTPAEDEEEFSC